MCSSAPKWPKKSTRCLQLSTSSSLSAGGDYRCDPLPVHLHGDSLPALPVSLPLLGGLLSLLCFSASHHVQDEPQGALLSSIRCRALPHHREQGRTCYNVEASLPITSRCIRGGRPPEHEDDKTCCNTAGTVLLCCYCFLGEE